MALPANITNILISQVLNNPALLEMLLKAAIPLLQDFLMKQAQGPTRPPLPVPVPDGSGIVEDDKILPPPAVDKGPMPVKFKLGFKMAQKKGADHPYSGEEFRSAVSGENPFNTESKIWFDSTPFQEDGSSVQEAEGAALGLLWKVRYEFTDPTGTAVVSDAGVGPEGLHVQNEANSSKVGIGITNWRSTKSYGVQVKPYGEGEHSVKAFLSLPDGSELESNTLTFRVA